MDLDDLEAEAVSVYERAGADPAEPPSMLALAYALFGDRLILGGTANARYERSTGRLFVARKKNSKKFVYDLAHELGEWWLEDRVPGERLETLSNALGARLIAPREAFRDAIRAWGPDVAVLADAFHLSQPATVLRIGEVLRRPVLVVGDGRLWCGIIPHQLELFDGRPTVEVVRDLLERRPQFKGMRQVEITDAPQFLAYVGE